MTLTDYPINGKHLPSMDTCREDRTTNCHVEDSTLENPQPASQSSLESDLGAAQEEGLQANLERFLVFLGVESDALVELQAIGVADGRFEAQKYAFCVAEDAYSLASEIENNAKGTYLVVNKQNEAIFSRAANGVWLDAKKGGCTNQDDMTHRRVVFIDVDAKRCSGTSATDEEMAHAADVGATIYQLLVEEVGISSVGYGHSGNGRQLYIALDDILESKALGAVIKEILNTLSAAFSNDSAHVDTCVSDAKRLVPAFGTIKRKGAEGVPHRPHRRTAFICQPAVHRCSFDDLASLLERLRKRIPEENTSGTARIAVKNAGTKKLTKDLPLRTTTFPSRTPGVGSKFAAANAVAVTDVLHWKNLMEGDKPICPGCGETNGVGIVGNGIKCHHARCVDKGVPDKGGFRTPVDIVCEVEGVSPVEAVTMLEQQFQLSPSEEVSRGASEKTLRGATLDYAQKTLFAHPAWQGVLAYDERNERVRFVMTPPWNVDFAGTEDTLPRDVTDSDIPRFVIWFQRKLGCLVSKDTVNDAITCAAQQNPFDEVKDYFDSLEWDHNLRLDTWMSDYFGAENTTFAREAGVAWLISAVARTYKPGCKADHVLVLEGDQGVGKSTGLAILAGREHFCDALHDLKSKDGAMQLSGKLVIELSELDALKRNELSTTKAFLSRTTDRYRSPYDRRPQDHKRRCVFAGSVNDSSYLADGTGNRRFWPIKCGKIDNEGLERDRDQLWAEAVERYKCDEPWWLSELAEVDARDAQGKRFVGDPWEPAIEKYLGTCCSSDGVSITELLAKVMGVRLSDQTRGQQMRCAQVLQRLGWDRRQIRKGDQRGKYRYFPVATQDRDSEPGDAGADDGNAGEA